MTLDSILRTLHKEEWNTIGGSNIKYIKYRIEPSGKNHKKVILQNKKYFYVLKEYSIQDIEDIIQMRYI